MMVDGWDRYVLDDLGAEMPIGIAREELLLQQARRANLLKRPTHPMERRILYIDSGQENFLVDGCGLKVELFDWVI